MEASQETRALEVQVLRAPQCPTMLLMLQLQTKRRELVTSLEPERFKTNRANGAFINKTSWIIPAEDPARCHLHEKRAPRTLAGPAERPRHPRWPFPTLHSQRTSRALKRRVTSQKQTDGGHGQTGAARRREAQHPHQAPRALEHRPGCAGGSTAFPGLKYERGVQAAGGRPRERGAPGSQPCGAGGGVRDSPAPAARRERLRDPASPARGDIVRHPNSASARSVTECGILAASVQCQKNGSPARRGARSAQAHGRARLLTAPLAVAWSWLSGERSIPPGSDCVSTHLPLGTTL